MSAPDVIVVGGGVIGLSIAYALAREGASVTVLDALVNGKASAVAAGMLAPLAESGGPGPFLDLSLASLRRYPEFVARLHEDVETHLEIFGPGMLRVARTEAEEEAQGAAFPWQQATGLPLARLQAEELRHWEPALGPEVRSAIFSSEERHVEPRHLQHTLLMACRRHGAEVHLTSAVTGFVTDGPRVTTVQTKQDDVSGGQVVICGGVWSTPLAEMLGVRLPVSPLRGQALSLGLQSPLPLRHTIYTHSGYLVPRSKFIIVGATEEAVGFDAERTAGGQAFLLNMALALAPPLALMPSYSFWAGLRPMSADALPLLGRVPGWDNVHVATGHGRNGILLTPITGDLMAAHLLHDVPPPPAFDPHRFSETSQCPSP